MQIIIYNRNKYVHAYKTSHYIHGKKRCDIISLTPSASIQKNECKNKIDVSHMALRALSIDSLEIKDVI